MLVWNKQTYNFVHVIIKGQSYIIRVSIRFVYENIGKTHINSKENVCILTALTCFTNITHISRCSHSLLLHGTRWSCCEVALISKKTIWLNIYTFLQIFRFISAHSLSWACVQTHMYAVLSYVMILNGQAFINRHVHGRRESIFLSQYWAKK